MRVRCDACGKDATIIETVHHQAGPGKYLYPLLKLGENPKSSVTFWRCDCGNSGYTIESSVEMGFFAQPLNVDDPKNVGVLRFRHETKLSTEQRQRLKYFNSKFQKKTSILRP